MVVSSNRGHNQETKAASTLGSRKMIIHPLLGASISLLMPCAKIFLQDIGFLPTMKQID